MRQNERVFGRIEHADRGTDPRATGRHRVGEVPGIGWVAVGIVTHGLSHEQGMRLEARATDRAEAERRLKMEIEAAFA